MYTEQATPPPSLLEYGGLVYFAVGLCCCVIIIYEWHVLNMAYGRVDSPLENTRERRSEPLVFQVFQNGVVMRTYS